MPVLRRVLATLLLGGLSAIVSLAVAAPATAHDQLLSTSPADGEVLTVAPSQLTLEFSADVLDLSTAVVLTPAGGTPTDLVTSIDGPTVTAALPADLPSGTYTVAWRVVSADGHPIEGTFGYVVDDPSRPPAAAPTATPTTSATEPAETESTSPQDPTSATPTATATLGQGSPSTDAPAVSTGVWVGLGLVLAVVVVVVVAVLRRRRRTTT
ncbi:copper resistance CopC family protein [Cellulomonas soli]|uniref:copper resistance CopC family protein n=1 Tax=Cellulomonas soli TaxID=931535 RepID=UPI003F849896